MGHVNASPGSSVTVFGPSSRGNWLSHEKVYLKNGFEKVATAPPGLDLLVKQLKAGPMPAFPQDWRERLAQYPSGVTIVYADQCPYMPDAVEHAVNALAERGFEAKLVRLESSAEVRARSPTAYGVFGIVCDGRLLSYHYLGKKALRRFDQEFVATAQ